MELEDNTERVQIKVNEYSYDDEKAVLRRQYFITTKIGAFALIVGTMHSWTSGIEKDVANGEFGFKMNRSEYIYLSALLPFGAILSAIPSVLLARKIGIKRTMQYLLIAATLSWLFLSTAINVYMFYVGRFLAGISVGCFKTLTTIYISEIVQTRRRGSFCCLGYELFLTLGILYDQILLTLFGAKMCTYLCSIIPLATFGISFFIPETPYYYIQRQDAFACKTALLELRGDEYDITSDYVEIYDNYKRYMNVQIPILQTLKQRITKKSIIMGFGLVFFQQLSGINAVLFYIYTMLKITEIPLKIDYAMIIMDILQTFGIFIGVILVDRIGRRLLLLVSEFTVTISAFGIAFYYYMLRHFPEAAKIINWVPLLCTSAYMVSFSVGLGAVAWLVLSELFPFNFRYYGCAAANIFQSSLTFVIVTLFYYFAANISVFGLFTGFSAFSLLGFFFVLIWIPETRNRKFSEIQAALNYKRLP